MNNAVVVGVDSDFVEILYPDWDGFTANDHRVVFEKRLYSDFSVSNFFSSNPIFVVFLLGDFDEFVFEREIVVVDLGKDSRAAFDPNCSDAVLADQDFGGRCHYR